MDKSILDKINKFTRRPLSEDEVYVFSVILCDNDIDRDCDRFSENALGTLREKFIGKTGIFDHDASTLNQNARIFDTELVTDDTRLTQFGKPYVYLKAMAYMVRTDENKNLIAEIDGGIKKDVSISCSAAKRICSVCGNDKNISTCNHVKGKKCGGSICHTVLDDITDAYEWSFVAVPAQVNAGVTKKYSDDDTIKSQAKDIQLCDEELRRDIRKAAYFAGGRAAADIASVSAANMNTQQLIALRRSFELQCRKTKTEVQLEYSAEADDTAECFTMR
ncbi:hypothetical protein SAMN02910265_02810 [Ruminococcus flavefaciens]|uniref:Uncharacterized protein n=1 Tax=Ruminococcus flavefaciens TaxID=1265 RepID=A0A1H6KX67_RUMFL|nr:hypothetical protein [Ruminococcus flavefaciens]SEH80530.1 hypothetical protein SAMN02910265_02810 [Ruminococcus flavefaciens]